MFYGYPMSQWIEVLEWFGLMIVLGIGTFIISCILTNKTLHNNNRRRKNNFKHKKAEKKSYFIDVA